ncbi:MAG: hypothetical protein AB9873_06590 [Syntrophobacteraceae bacterium]
MEGPFTDQLQQWKVSMEETWRRIPKPYRNDHTVRRTLQCFLYGQLKKAGFRVVADYLPPRIADRPIDLIALNDDMEIVHALCIDTLVSLAAVKSLSSFEAVHKVIFTTGMLEKKVKESRFFLKPELEHVHLKPFEHSE